eukprot:m.164335 g.164335  ORF g.164335 m.164335 type:complete len:384 (-) comp12407_c0_seq1:494-1645(-)
MAEGGGGSAVPNGSSHPETPTATAATLDPHATAPHANGLSQTATFPMDHHQETSKSPCLKAQEAAKGMRADGIAWMSDAVVDIIKNVVTAAHQAPQDAMSPDLAAAVQAAEATNIFASTEEVMRTSVLWKEDVQFLGLYHDPVVSISVFLVKEGGAIPLHNHPHMIVYSNLLFGELEEMCYTLEDSEAGAASEGGGKKKGGKVRTKRKNGKKTKQKTRASTAPATDAANVIRARITGCKLRNMDEDRFSMIEPGCHNLHSLKARTCCAFLDVFTPPYADGVRDCVYYRHVDTKDSSAGEAEAEPPTANGNGDAAATQRRKDEDGDAMEVEKVVEDGEAGGGGGVRAVIPRDVLLETFVTEFVTGNYAETAAAIGMGPPPLAPS